MLALSPNASARFAYFLLLWARERGQKAEEGVRVPLSMSEEELGETIDVTRETVSRILANLERHKLIRRERHSILLLRPDALRALASV